MEDEQLDSAPIWTDVRSFDARRLAGDIDIVIGGFPCTDVSVAGARAGIDGEESGLWSEMRRIIGECRPPLVWIENVPGLLSTRSVRDIEGAGVGEGATESVRGLGVVLSDLADLGYDAEWTSISAADLGASQLRKRIFILGYTPVGNPAVSGLQERGSPADERRIVRDDRPPADGSDPGVYPYWPPGPGERERWGQIIGRWPELAPAVANDARERARELHVRQGEPGGPPADVGRAGARGNGEEAESAIRDVASGNAARLALSRAQQLRALGGLVIPLQAAAAFSQLAVRAGIGEIDADGRLKLTF